MNKGIYRIAAGVGAAVILVSSATAQAATVTANGTPAPVASDSIAGWPAAPAVTSETAVLIDADTGAVLYDKGMDEYRYPASTTKIMTLLVAIENSSPKDIVTFTETGIRDVTWDSSNINAQLGETMTMKDCWMAAYIKSANEVCAQIAETVGGTEANFVEMMNQKAKELGCTHTHFANASGLPDENHYSSAHDLAKIMRACLRNKRFRQVMKCSNYKIPATNLSEARVMHTHMPLMAKESNLYYADCIGGKTGFSTDAQHTLVTAAERNGHTAERNGKTLTRYYYSGQFVGYVAEAQPTETPAVEETAETAAESSETEAAETVTDSLETTENDSQAEVQTGQKSMSEQIQEIRTEGLSGMMKALLIAMGVMAVILIALLIALYIKNG